MDTHLPNTHRGILSSPDLRIRESTLIWGPLAVTIHTHREGAERGYSAGKEAYQEITQQRQGIGITSLNTLERIMTTYLTMPRHRPRNITPTIVHEWKALFILGWSAQILEDLDEREAIPPSRETYESLPTPQPATQALTTREREESIMIEVDLDPETRHTDPHYRRKEREAKRACKEFAGWQCEYLYKNKTRCSARHGQLQRKKGRGGEPDGWKVTRMHGCHVGNKYEKKQRFICLCAKHHMEYDRGIEQLEQPSYCYRRGYQTTSTDALLEAMQYTGISMWEEPDGYHWKLDGFDLGGSRTTAVGAVSAAIAQTNTLRLQSQQELEDAQRTIARLTQQSISLGVV